MRELKPTGEEDLAEGGFADIEALAEQCKFRDCRHDREPGCAVRAAIEAGTLDPQRLANYFKLRDEVAGAADKLATRLAQKAGDKVQGKAPNKRLDDKYGRHGWPFGSGFRRALSPPTLRRQGRVGEGRS